MPFVALSLGIVALACSLSVSLFYVGVALGLLGTVLALLAWRRLPVGARRLGVARWAAVVSAIGLVIGLGIWFVHVRAIQTAYHVPDRGQLLDDFGQRLATATAPRPGAPPRTLPPPHAEKKTP